MGERNYATTPGLFKATPHQDGERRLVVIEPSAEVVDLEDELILQEALWKSRDYFMAKGNLDVDHMSWIGYQKGVADQDYYDVGRPIEVKGGPERVVVVGEVARGSELADKIWSRMTEREPPIRYYPSIGAHREESETAFENGKEIRKTSRLRWVNIAFCKEPVNPDVLPIRTMQPQAMAKAMMMGIEEIDEDLLARAAWVLGNTINKGSVACMKAMENFTREMDEGLRDEFFGRLLKSINPLPVVGEGRGAE